MEDLLSVFRSIGDRLVRDATEAGMVHGCGRTGLLTKVAGAVPEHCRIERTRYESKFRPPRGKSVELGNAMEVASQVERQHPGLGLGEGGHGNVHIGGQDKHNRAQVGASSSDLARNKPPPNI